MAKKTVLQKPVSSESQPRNPFDRSYIYNGNFSAGMINLTFAKRVYGKSHVRINQRSFMRSTQVLAPAFPQLPMYTDFVFVPFSQIYSQYLAFKTKTNDQVSSSLPIPKRLPYYPSSSILDLLDSMSNYKDAAGFDADRGAVRLLDNGDYGINNSQINFDSLLTDSEVNDVGHLNVSVLAAYQKAYYDLYRNTAYEANDVTAYNLDQFINSDGTVNQVSDAVMKKLLTLRYVNARKDAFKTVYPSLNFIASSANGLHVTNGTIPLPSSVVGLGIPGYTNTAPRVFSSDSITPSGAVPVSGQPVAQGGFTLQNFRAALAYEKLVRVSAFAPQHVKDQFKARFGYEPERAKFGECVRLKSFRNDIILGEVTSTAAVAATELGQIGGKGVGASDFEDPISYDVPEDGLILGLTYVLPNLCYDARGIEPMNQSFVPEDFALPEYANLGLQPLYWKNLFTTFALPDGSRPPVADVSTYLNKVVGYQPRSMEDKISVSKNHGNFANIDREQSAFVTHGDFRFRRFLPSDGINYTYFKMIPQEINFMFAQQQVTGDEYDDQFFGTITVQFGAIQDMPIFGVTDKL